MAVTIAKKQPKCYISLSLNFLPRDYHSLQLRQQHSDNMPASLSTEVNLKEASHTQCNSFGSSLIYSEYSIASKVDNCYFAECILGLNTIKHTYIINIQVHYRCKKICIDVFYIFIKSS